MSLVIENQFAQRAVYELRYAVNRLLDRLAAAEEAASEASRVADACDDGHGGVLKDCELKIIDAAEAMTGELFLLEEALPEIYRMFDRIVQDGYASLPEEEFE